MTYSQKLYPRDEFEFPAPPLWLTWKGCYGQEGQGITRHHDTLTKAKKYVSCRAWKHGCWTEPWAIYEWDGSAGKYILAYDGEAGQAKVDNPLFKKRAHEKALIHTILGSRGEYDLVLNTRPLCA